MFDALLPRDATQSNMNDISTAVGAVCMSPITAATPKNGENITCLWIIYDIY